MILKKKFLKMEVQFHYILMKKTEKIKWWIIYIMKTKKRLLEINIIEQWPLIMKFWEIIKHFGQVELKKRLILLIVLLDFFNLEKFPNNNFIKINKETISTKSFKICSILLDFLVKMSRYKWFVKALGLMVIYLLLTHSNTKNKDFHFWILFIMEWALF